MLRATKGGIAVVQLESLDDTAGDRIAGLELGGANGYAVAAAGDVNGDGVADVVIGAPGVGKSYVLFGGPNGPTADLDALDDGNGLALVSDISGERAGASVSGVGDVNADGVDDLLIGVDLAGYQGKSYLIFGAGNLGEGDEPVRDLGDLVEEGGAVLLRGSMVKSPASSTVAGGGDVNGDGISDFIVGAPFASPNGFAATGETYVVFGSGDGWGPEVSLDKLNGEDGEDGFTVVGSAFGEQSGASVANAGDVNGDGDDDVVIGTVDSSKTYVVFGQATGFPDRLSVSSLDGTNGFVLTSNVPGYGFVVAGVGDVNGDGLDDIALGARETSLGGPNGPVRSFVVFGREDGFPREVSLDGLAGDEGFVIQGGKPSDDVGAAIAGAGDVNNDGVDDIIVGAPGAEGTGASYVIFGQQGGFPALLSLAALDETEGVVFEGAAAGDRSGAAVAGVGDINVDDIDDLAIGAPFADPDGQYRAGVSYLVYGSPDIPDDHRGEVVLAVNAGGPALIQDDIAFEADSFFTAGDRVYVDNDNDNGNGEQTSFDGTVYETERFGSAVEYALPVAPGSYSVELHFAEIWWEEAGQRIFEIAIEGRVVAGDYDILEATNGDIDQSAILTIDDVSPDIAGGADTIDILMAAEVNNAKISAIMVRASGESSAPPPTDGEPEPEVDMGGSGFDDLF